MDAAAMSRELHGCGIHAVQVEFTEVIKRRKMVVLDRLDYTTVLNPDLLAAQRDLLARSAVPVADGDDRHIVLADQGGQVGRCWPPRPRRRPSADRAGRQLVRPGGPPGAAA